MCIPPFTCNVLPVIYEAPGELGRAGLRDVVDVTHAAEWNLREQSFFMLFGERPRHAVSMKPAPRSSR